MSDITVSNGRHVVATDTEGRFQLPGEGAFVVVTRPTNYTAEPWFVPSTSEEIHFVLEPQAQTLPYEFVHLTDTHLTVPGGEKVIGSRLYNEGSLPAQITGFLGRLHELAPNAQSIMVTGDLVDNGLPAEYEAYVAAIAESPVPVHLIPGNHDHMNGTHGTFVSRNNYMTNVGTPENYERYIGPRWYSFDVAGLHVVAMDWHSHELGLDHGEQNEWVAADLARLEPGADWILLFHDQPGASVLDHVPWMPRAAFSGHWHTSRVVEVDGALHVNSPTTFFASLDYTPPAFRTVTWDGERITLRTQALPSVEVAPALGDVSTATFAARSGTADQSVLWRAELAGAGHRQRVSVDRELVFAGSQIEDEAAGSVEAIDLATGEVRWRAMTNSAVKTTPLAVGAVVVAAEVSGDVTAWDRETGELAWRLPSSDPLRRFAWGGPAVADGRVYLGDQADLRCIDASTGELVWRRTDLSPHHNLVNHAAPLIVDDLLIMGFWPTPHHPVGLDRATGATRWATGEADGSGTFEFFKRLLIMGTAAFDAATDSVLMPAFGSTTRVDRSTGTVLWAQAHEGGFSPATPLVTNAGYVVTVTGRGIRLIDREEGRTVWDLPVSGDAPFPMSSYTKTPHPVIAAPTAVGEDLLLPGLDGVIRRIGLDGRMRGQEQFSSPFAASLVDAGTALLAVGVDGGVIAIDRGVAA